MPKRFLALICLSCAPVFAHVAKTAPIRNEPAFEWEFDPLVILGLAISAILYVRGIIRLWRATKIGSGVRRWQASAFAGGWLATFLALVSPIHKLGQSLFFVHMTQHELLMLLAAP